ncbi:DUF2851 family protein [uncultured Polaribacter sp.]|uniref:DUF2851 family protein n=1 Tax=uncultured Polaribacter sp. TaxID=174711 RepID=UPI0026373278|nr:DUF2851 family protein [uncultured Polaribacter sp.]
MNEDFLHYVWKYQLFSAGTLKTSTNEDLVVVKVGMHNQNSGPDFLNAQIKIADKLWVGNVEIHVKSSDWYLHNHEIDYNYNAVILHVVWEDDAVIFLEKNTVLPTLVLKNITFSSALQNYQNLFSTQQRWISCENEIYNTDKFVFENWKERLFFERLERKSNEMKLLLTENNDNYEATLFQVLAKNFGLKVNGDAFLLLAKSFDFGVLRKVRFNETQLAALLYGQAGFLEDNIEEVYYKALQKEYAYLRHKYHLKPIAKNQFSFFRMRPHNFPTIRIAQLTALYVAHQNLFSKTLETNTVDDFHNLFSVQVHSFWRNHFTFQKQSKTSTKKLTVSFLDLLLINTIIPLKFLYQKNRGEVDELDFLELLKQMTPEKNSIISKFEDMQVLSKSAYDSQTLLELKNNYCTKKRCLQCAIGMEILKN